MTGELSIRIDSHAHLYDCYDVESWCAAALRNLTAGNPTAISAVVVVDREGQDSSAMLARKIPRGYSWTPFDSVPGGVVRGPNGSLFVLGGAQYVARERIEVLSLGGSRASLEGHPASEIVDAIAREGLLPCLPWSPGKWLGPRGRVVEKLLHEREKGDLTVGDISIRPALLRSPLLEKATSLGFRVLRGSDPLPAPAEEQGVGAYGQELRIQADQTNHDSVARAILVGLRTGDLHTIGRPNNPLKAAIRFIRSQRARS